jgi:hypothetical protein
MTNSNLQKPLNIFFFLIVIPVGILLTSCAEEEPTFSLLPERNYFVQKTDSFSNKIDILWVIDNSGSMANLQANVANNFESFINSFVDKSYEFQIAVTTTDAYLEGAVFEDDPEYARFRDGTDDTSHTGVYVITPETPDLVDTFMINITQGTHGDGDERAFQSMTAALNSSLNAGFLRPDAFLAVIIVSDEDDFSHDGAGYINRDYNHPDIHPVSDYVDYLKAMTGNPTIPRHSVSSIAIYDDDCNAQNQPWGLIADRYGALVEATDGVNGSVCADDFSVVLDSIQARIAELSTQFELNREPVIGTIRVSVNGEQIPEDVDNGWSYYPETNSIMFHGSAIPEQGASIIIDFDPTTIK